MTAGEQKFVVFRTRFECHATSATAINLGVTLTITHVGDAELPYYIANHNDHDPEHPDIGNVITVVKGIILQ